MKETDTLRYDVAEKLIRLCVFIRSRPNGVTIQEIQEELGKQRRTAERIIEFLKNTYSGDFDVVYTDGRTKYWGFKPEAKIPLITLNQEDLSNLELAKNLFESNGNDIKAKSIDTIINKIKAAKIDSKFQNTLEQLNQIECVTVRQHPRDRIDPETFAIIKECATLRWKLKFDYIVDKELKQGITVNPYGLFYAQKIYLVAYNDYVKDYRLYNISKIQNITKIYEKFDKDQDFDLQKYAAQSFGTFQEKPFDVVLKFSPEVKEDVRNYYFHPTQELIENEDDSTTVTFCASGFREIMWEVFKWETDVEIIAPQELKDFYKDKLHKISENI